MRQIPLILILAAAFTTYAQIPSGYVQTTATVSSLANGTYGASWTNLSSSPQLGLLGCVSTFQQTVNGRFDSNGHMSVLLADTAQICPTPSTWTFTLTFECVGSPTNGAFQVAVPVTGGGGIPNYNGSSAWGTSYSAGNLIPNTFINWAAPSAIGGTTPAAGTFSSITIPNDGVHPNQLALPWNTTANAAPTNATGWEGAVASSGTAGWFDLPSALPSTPSVMVFAAVASAHSVGTTTTVLGSGSLSTMTAATPADNATCTAGQLWFDASYIYICTASGTVKRATLATF